jgi:hypothetical protein
MSTSDVCWPHDPDLVDEHGNPVTETTMDDFNAPTGVTVTNASSSFRA